MYSHESMPLTFSERNNLVQKPYLPSKVISENLRTGLWNAFLKTCWANIFDWQLDNETTLYKAKSIDNMLVRELWEKQFKLPLDELTQLYFVRSDIKKKFLTEEWYKIYDLIEFIATTFSGYAPIKKFVVECNHILKNEGSQYRFVDGLLIQVTSEEEISALEKTMNETRPITTVYTHLSEAAKLMSKRTDPDYRNSIKESISAVEAICKIITKQNNATLDNALKEIETKQKVQIHPALTTAFRKIYSYTSDADGIRHALMEDANLDLEDATFMLMTCSNFVHYLIAKSAKSNISLN